jgi:hypothetical protein
MAKPRKLPEHIERELVAAAEAHARAIARRKRTDIVALKLRLREALRKRLEVAAKGQERSLNSEIVARLEQSFDREGLTRIRDQADRALTSIQEQARRRDELLETVIRLAFKEGGSAEARQAVGDYFRESAHNDEPELPMPQQSRGK